MANRVVEYIIRALDFTKPGVNSAKNNVRSLAKDSSDDLADMRKKFSELQGGCDDLAKKTNEVSAASAAAREKMVGLAGAIGSVFVAFKVGWEIGKKINEWISPTMRLAAAWDKVSAAVERSKKFVAEKTAEHKAELDAQAEGYDDKRKGIERTSGRDAKMRSAFETPSVSVEEADRNLSTAKEIKRVADEEVAQLERQLAEVQKQKSLRQEELPGKAPKSFFGVELNWNKKRTDAATRNAMNAYSIDEGKIGNIEDQLKAARGRQEEAGFEVDRASAEKQGAKNKWNADVDRERKKYSETLEKEELKRRKQENSDAKKAADRRKVLETQRAELMQDMNRAVAQEKADRLNSMAETMRIEARRRMEGGPRTAAEFDGFLANQAAGRADSKAWAENESRYDKVLGKVFSGKRLTGSEKKFMDEMNAFNVAKGMQAKAEALAQEAQKATVESKRTLDQINAKLTFLEKNLQGN